MSCLFFLRLDFAIQSPGDGLVAHRKAVSLFSFLVLVFTTQDRDFLCLYRHFLQDLRHCRHDCHCVLCVWIELAGVILSC